MPRAMMAAALLTCLTLTAGCSGSAPTTTATGSPTSAPTTTAATPTSTSTAGPLEGLSALEVWRRTRTDAAAARSMHVAGRFLDGSQTVGINLKMNDQGKAFGALSFNGDRIVIRRLESTLYFKADRGFWTTNADAATAKTLANKWIMTKQGASAGLEQFFELTDMDFILADALDRTAEEQRTMKLTTGADVGTQRTVGLADEAGAETSDYQTLYVSATDAALPLNFVIGSDRRQYMKFRSWNQDFTVVAPADAIDLAQAG